MKLNVKIDFNSKTEEAADKALKAARLAMRDTVVAIWSDSIKPPSPYLTGHNRRSMVGEVSGMGEIKKGRDAVPEKVVDDRKLEGAIYSTSGYGGFLETGTRNMAARPYIKPAADRHVPNFPKRMKEHLG